MNPRRLGPVVIALSLLALAAVAGATAADGTATTQQAQNATNNATPDAWFADDRPAVEQGQVAAMDVRLNHTSEATVVVGSNTSAYRLVVSVTDGDGDGRVGLQVETAGVGPNRIRFSTFQDADGVDLLSRSGGSGALPAQGYSLQVYLNGTTGQPADTAVLTVRGDESAATTTVPPTSGPTTNPTTSDSTTETDTTPATTTEGQPGFGIVVALVGVVAATLLAVRR